MPYKVLLIQRKSPDPTRSGSLATSDSLLPLTPLATSPLPSSHPQPHCFIPLSWQSGWNHFGLRAWIRVFFLSKAKKTYAYIDVPSLWKRVHWREKVRSSGPCRVRIEEVVRKPFHTWGGRSLVMHRLDKRHPGSTQFPCAFMAWVGDGSEHLGSFGIRHIRSGLWRGGWACSVSCAEIILTAKAEYHEGQREAEEPIGWLQPAMGIWQPKQRDRVSSKSLLTSTMT